MWSVARLVCERGFFDYYRLLERRLSKQLVPHHWLTARENSEAGLRPRPSPRYALRRGGLLVVSLSFVELTMCLVVLNCGWHTKVADAVIRERMSRVIGAVSVLICWVSEMQNGRVFPISAAG